MKSAAKITLALFFTIFVSAKEVALVQPRSVHLNDPKQSVRLAISEKINANLVGALSYSIQYVPEHSGECKIKSVRDHFREVASRNLHPGYYSMVTSIINLKENNLTVLIDQNLYIAAFEIKDGGFKDKVVNRTLREPNSENFHDTPLLVADQNETYMLAITPLSFYVINISSLAKGELSFKQVKQSLGESLVRIQIFDGVLFVATRQAGIKVFKVNPNQATVQFLYSIHDHNMMCQDFAIQKKTKMLYMLDFERGIQVYNITTSDKKPAAYDFIDISHKTRKNQKIQIQNRVILVAFYHRSENIVAQINYRVQEKKFSFMRYFKFKDILMDIHLMDEHMIAIGDVFVAVFPVNIHPKLIQTQMNGNIALSPIRKVIQFKGSYFIGLTHDSLMLGQVQVDNSDEISCALKDNSKLKKIVYKANITSCGTTRQYYDFCTYTKQVEFQKMDVIAGESTARGLWVAILILCGAIVVGVLSLYLLKRKKERTIQFLQAQFQKRKSMFPLPSQRLSQRVSEPLGSKQMNNIPAVPLTEQQFQQENK